MREGWTDERLDDFARNVEQRFDRLEKKIDEGVRELRGEINAFQRVMIQFAGVLVAALAGLFAAQVGLFVSLL